MKALRKISTGRRTALPGVCWEHGKARRNVRAELICSTIVTAGAGDCISTQNAIGVRDHKMCSLAIYMDTDIAWLWL
jgi:hypothetical protein